MLYYIILHLYSHISLYYIMVHICKYEYHVKHFWPYAFASILQVQQNAKTPKLSKTLKRKTQGERVENIVDFSFYSGFPILINFSPFLFVVNAKIPGNIKVYALEPNRRNFLHTQAVAF